MEWQGTDSWCAVVDDGRGMNEDQLKEAMRIGSAAALEDRAGSDLGRFGFGLKTASFSQARELTVGSRKRASFKLHARCWDTDHVEQTGRWLMRRGAPARSKELLEELQPAGSGTVVLWRDLISVLDTVDQLGDQDAALHFRSSIRSVELQIGMIFSRFIADARLVVKLNGQVVKAWDPFLENEDATQRLPVETPTYRGHEIAVAPFVLPHENKLRHTTYEDGGGPGGWNTHQGFYVYRRDRLISPGDWLGLNLPRNDAYNLARIAIDIPAELDAEWSLNVNKTSVRPPNALVRDLKRIADDTRKRAKRVFTGRGGIILDPDRHPNVRTVWRQTRRQGEVRFVVDRDHPLVRAALLDPSADAVRDLLNVIERTIPVPYLPPRNDDEVPALADLTPEQVYEVAERIFNVLLANGNDRAKAIELLGQLEPLNQYPDVIKELTERR